MARAPLPSELPEGCPAEIPDIAPEDAAVALTHSDPSYRSTNQLLSYVALFGNLPTIPFLSLRGSKEPIAFVADRLSAHDVIMIEENHAVLDEVYLAKGMEKLKAAGLKSVALELPVFLQESLDKTLQGGIQYLVPKLLRSPGTLAVARAAFAQDISVHCVDSSIRRDPKRGLVMAGRIRLLETPVLFLGGYAQARRGKGMFDLSLRDYLEMAGKRVSVIKHENNSHYYLLSQVMGPRQAGSFNAAMLLYYLGPDYIARSWAAPTSQMPPLEYLDPFAGVIKPYAADIDGIVILTDADSLPFHTEISNYNE